MTLKAQNIKISKQHLGKEKPKGNVAIVRCTRCGKYQGYKPKAKNVKRRNCKYGWGRQSAKSCTNY